MLRPSYAELMDTLNSNTEEKDEVTSRYTIVIAAAKRARQIIDGDEPMVTAVEGKPLSTAVDELKENKIRVVPEGKGTVLKNKKKQELQEEINKELRENEEDPIFDHTTVETISKDEFEESGISESMIEEEGEF